MRHPIGLTPLLLVLTLLLAGTAAAQGTTITLSGYLVILSGDPPHDSALAPQQVIVLQDTSGENLAKLSVEASSASQTRGQPVRVTGKVAGVTLSPLMMTSQPLPLIEVTNIELTAASPGTAAQTAVTGSKPWVNILCKFSDINTTPYSPAQYQSLFSSTYPGLNHYWQQISYGQINIDGTMTISRWVTLPLPRASYVPLNGSADLGKLFDDCVNAADADVNFGQFTGINLMFNDWLDCCAWGGWRTTTLDGQTKTWSVTWLPPWAQRYDYLAHEMGHGFGLLHSSGPSVNPPSGTAVYVSQWDVMSLSKGSCQVKDKTFGCIPPGTIAYQQEMSGWIPENRIAIVNPGQITTLTLDRLRQPESSTNYLLAKIPISDSPSRFYTVEARFRLLGHSNYDQNVPSSAVIIHDVMPGRGGWPGTNTGPALVVVENPSAGLPVYTVNGAGAAWDQGETFHDAANDIHVTVVNHDSSTFTVRIVNQALEPPTLLAPADTSATTNALPTLTWNAVEKAVSYDVQIDTTPDFSSGAVIAAQTTAAQFTVPGKLAAGRSYYWRVRARTGSGTPSGWSAVSRFTLESDSAAVPIVQYANATPTLSWGAVTWATGYDVMVGRTTTFSATSFRTAVSAGSVSVTTTPLELGLYYWRVCPRRQNGTYGTCSAVDRFVINVP